VVQAKRRHDTGIREADGLGSTRFIRVPVVQHVEGNLDGPELNPVFQVSPGFRDVVRLDPNGDQQGGTEKHAGHNALATFEPEAFRQGDFFGGPV
jgi:hypothetical protein